MKPSISETLKNAANEIRSWSATEEANALVDALDALADRLSLEGEPRVGDLVHVEHDESIIPPYEGVVVGPPDGSGFVSVCRVVEGWVAKDDVDDVRECDIRIIERAGYSIEVIECCKGWRRVSES